MPARRSPPGKHIVMVNVEADVLAGPLLAEEARANGVVYSLAYGDQPALTCEMVDWARACGFEVVAAGKGTKYLPAYHAVTPDDVWAHYGLTPRGGEPRRDEPADVQLVPRRHQIGDRDGGDRQRDRPCGAAGRACISRPAASTICRRSCAAATRAAQLDHDGMVEVVSSLERDGRPVFRDLRWGVYVVLKAPNDYARTCFKEYGLKTDAERLVRRDVQALPPDRAGTRHLGVVGGTARRADRSGDAAGAAMSWRSPSGRSAAGETLDGEGGYTVWGKLVPAERSFAEGALPIGLAHKVPLKRDIAAGAVVHWGDVEIPDSAALRVRREMEQRFAGPSAAIAAQ